MASRTIATILNLRDNMSRGLVRVNRNVENMTRETRRASQQVANFANNTKKNFEKAGDKAIKLSATIAGVVGTIATKMGFSEAMDMEGYKVQLETAVKDTKKAGQLMADSVKFANKTPFETGEVVQATSKMEMYGLSSKRWLADVADMAGSTNKSIDQATEAMADVAVGEFERIKEFGLKKDMILAESNKKYGKGVVFNAKGQVVDQAKLMDVVQSMMQQKFKGGAEKLANTSKGMWSTITGVTKSSLAKIVGMQEDGTIKQGSMMDKLKQKIQQVADTLQKWQSNGTIQKISDTATNVFTKLFNIISKVFNFLIEHRKAIENIAIVFSSFYIAIKIMTILKGVIFGVQIAMALLNGTLALSPLGWVTLIIAGVIAIGVLLWRNWDWVQKKASELWNWLVQAWNGIYTSVSNLCNTLVTSIANAWSGLMSSLSNIWNSISTTFSNIWSSIGAVFSNIWSGISSTAKSILNGIIDGINNVIRGINSLASFKVPDWVPGVGGKGISVSIPTIPHFAKGTQYSPKGLAMINEKGGEIRRLSSGETIIPADKSEKLINKTSMNEPTFIINFNGNVGEDEFFDKAGDRIVKKIKLALDIM